MRRLLPGFVAFWILLPLLSFGQTDKPVPTAQTHSPREGEDLIGTQAHEWKAQDWFHSKPLLLKDLKGKVILVRFWTAPGCPFCVASAPALNELYQKYHDRGLEVLGLYHHKSSEPLRKEDVQAHAGKFGFKFPVAIDYDWKTLKDWWLASRQRAWTSVSFLIDRKGIIRHIHPGGQYVKGDPDYAVLENKIQELLTEHS